MQNVLESQGLKLNVCTAIHLHTTNPLLIRFKFHFMWSQSKGGAFNPLFIPLHTFVQLQKARTRMFGFPVEAKMHSFDNAADSGGFVIWNSMNKKSNCSAEQCWRIFTMLAKVVGTIRNQLTADCAFFVQYPKNIKIKTFDTQIY